MLPKFNRLPASEFPNVLRRGQRASVPVLQLAVTANQLKISRFGFIVNTQVDSRAAGRNRIKRLLRESVRLALAQILPGYDIILLAKQTPTPLNYQQVSQVVKKLLIQANLLKHP